MKINSFLQVLNTKKTKEEKEKYISSMIVDKYIPLEEKQVRAQNIIKSSYYLKDNNGNETFHINSVAKYMLTYITLIDIYTDIERSASEGKIVEEFNKLNEAGIFDILVQSINQRELKEFNMVLDMEVNDVMTNEYEPGGFVRNQVTRFGNLVGATLLPLLQTLDMNKIEEIVKNAVGEISK